MATDTRNIVITIKSETQGGGNDEPTANPEAKSKEKDKSVALAAALASRVVGETISQVVAWAEYEWNKSLMLTDDYVGQRDKRKTLQAINKVVSSTSSIISATMMGSMAGPIGAVAGFVIGLGTEITRTVIGNERAAEQQEIKLRQMDLQLDFTRQRAGWSTRAASIGEDL